MHKNAGIVASASILFLFSTGVANAAGSVVYNFSGTPNGANPSSGVIVNTDGVARGVTSGGGRYNFGTIFRLTASGSVSTIYSFAGGADGATPLTPLTPDSSGNLFGTTITGGTFNYGTVFVLTAGTQQHQVLYSFHGGSDGGQPNQPLVIFNGALYGSTSVGGSSSCPGQGLGTCGVVYRVQQGPTGVWQETPIYTFTSYADGYQPGSLGVSPDGSYLIGSAQGGSKGWGSVFALYPPSSGSSVWTKKTLYEFTGVPNTIGPVGQLLIDSAGNIYGTGGGGTGCPSRGPCGVVFALVAPQSSGGAYTEVLLHTFNGNDGASPLPDLQVSPDGSHFYGMTSAGGIGFDGTNTGGYGTVFTLDLSNWAFSTIYQLPGGTGPAYPRTPFVFTSNTSVFGVSSNGGSGCPSNQVGCGTIFRASP